jgi:tripartite-type tricarboxylate transporter receptor subunit TctC
MRATRVGIVFPGMLLGICCGIAAGSAYAQSAASRVPGYPTKPIRLIDAFPPGGGSDFVARLVSPKVAEALGQQIVHENRPGAGGTIGAEFALRAAPDGYTVLAITGSYTVNPSVYKLAYDPLDITPIAQTGAGPFVMVVHPSVPAKTAKDLVGLAKARPGVLNFGSTGTGGITHLATEHFRLTAGMEATHIPYKGTGPAVIDLLGGQLHFMIAAGAGVMHHVRANKLRALATTGPKRAVALPDLPTVAESGVPGYDVLLWYGILAPRGFPKELHALWNAEVNRATQLPDVKERLASAGLEPAPGTPEDFARQLKREIERWAVVVKKAGVKIN